LAHQGVVYQTEEQLGKTQPGRPAAAGVAAVNGVEFAGRQPRGEQPDKASGRAGEFGRSGFFA